MRGLVSSWNFVVCLLTLYAVYSDTQVSSGQRVVPHLVILVSIAIIFIPVRNAASNALVSALKHFLAPAFLCELLSNLHITKQKTTVFCPNQNPLSIMKYAPSQARTSASYSKERGWFVDWWGQCQCFF